MLNTPEQLKLAQKEWEELFKQYNITDETMEKTDFSYLDEEPGHGIDKQVKM